MKRRWPWIVAGIVAVAALVAFAAPRWLGNGGGQGNPGETRARAGERRPADESDRSSPQERERRELELAIRGHDGKVQRLLPTDEGWMIDAELRSEDASLITVAEDARKLFKSVAATGATVRHAAVLFRTDALKDVYGHQLKDVAIARIFLTGDTLRRINWNGFEVANFPRVADELWLHDELKAQLSQLQPRKGDADEQQQSQQGNGGQQQGGGGGGDGSS